MVLLLDSALAFRDDGVEVFVCGGLVFGVGVVEGEVLEVGLVGVMSVGVRGMGRGKKEGSWGAWELGSAERGVRSVECGVRKTDLVQAKVTTSERRRPRRRFKTRTRPLGSHFLPRLILMPLLPLLLPLDQRVDFLNRDILINLSHIDRALKQRIHVQLPALGPISQELEDPFQPAHELAEETVVVDVDFVNEFVEVIFVAGAEVDEGLDRLVRVGGDVLALGALDGVEHVVGEGGEVGDAIVDVGGFIDAYEGFVEDGEEVAEELEGYRLHWVSGWI